MRPSKFNYYVKDTNTDTHIIMNGVSENSIRVSNVNFDSISRIINYPDDNYSQYSKFIDTMLDYGLIIRDEVDESDLIKKKYKENCRENEFSIMILPTYQCNVRCWYCIQNHSDMWMEDSVVNNIKARIEKALNDVDTLCLFWFGGEPLLCYDNVLSLTKWARVKAYNAGKKFNCSITSNGTLLNKERISALREAGVGSYQISIDGQRSVHDKVKQLGKCSAFDKTMENIGEIIQHTSCTLRLNYTKENLQPEEIINDIDSSLPKSGRGNLTFLIYKVWQEESCGIDDNLVVRLSELAMSIGLVPRYAVLGMCYTDQKHFECIFPNGRVGKCDNLEPEDSPGLLIPGGNIRWIGDISSYKTIVNTEANECHTCKYLPLCWGPCMAKRNLMLQHKGQIWCQFDDKEKEIHQLIINEHRNREYTNRIIQNHV